MLTTTASVSATSTAADFSAILAAGERIKVELSQRRIQSTIQQKNAPHQTVPEVREGYERSKFGNIIKLREHKTHGSLDPQFF